MDRYLSENAAKSHNISSSISTIDSLENPRTSNQSQISKQEENPEGSVKHGGNNSTTTLLAAPGNSENASSSIKQEQTSQQPSPNIEVASQEQRPTTLPAQITLTSSQPLSQHLAAANFLASPRSDPLLAASRRKAANMDFSPNSTSQPRSSLYSQYSPILEEATQVEVVQTSDPMGQQSRTPPMMVRSISINKVRESTQQLESLLSEIQSLRRTTSLSCAHYPQPPTPDSAVDHGEFPHYTRTLDNSGLSANPVAAQQRRVDTPLTSDLSQPTSGSTARLFHHCHRRRNSSTDFSTMSTNSDGSSASRESSSGISLTRRLSLKRSNPPDRSHRVPLSVVSVSSETPQSTTLLNRSSSRQQRPPHQSNLSSSQEDVQSLMESIDQYRSKLIELNQEKRTSLNTAIDLPLKQPHQSQPSPNIPYPPTLPPLSYAWEKQPTLEEEMDDLLLRHPTPPFASTARDSGQDSSAESFKTAPSFTERHSDSDPDVTLPTVFNSGSKDNYSSMATAVTSDTTPEGHTTTSSLSHSSSGNTVVNKRNMSSTSPLSFKRAGGDVRYVSTETVSRPSAEEQPPRKPFLEPDSNRTSICTIQLPPGQKVTIQHDPVIEENIRIQRHQASVRDGSVSRQGQQELESQRTRERDMEPERPKNSERREEKERQECHEHSKVKDQEKLDRPERYVRERYERHRQKHHRSKRVASMPEQTSATYFKHSCSKSAFAQPNIQRLLDLADDSFRLDQIDLPPDERHLLEKFVDALSKLSVEINLDDGKRVEGKRRLHNALRAIEGWI